MAFVALADPAKTGPPTYLNPDHIVSMTPEPDSYDASLTVVKITLSGDVPALVYPCSNELEARKLMQLIAEAAGLKTTIKLSLAD